MLNDYADRLLEGRVYNGEGPEKHGIYGKSYFSKPRKWKHFDNQKNSIRQMGRERVDFVKSNFKLKKKGLGRYRHQC